jgi:two-component system, chemotaxis family, sensor kinase CheA
VNQCYPVFRRNRQFGTKTNITKMTDGIILMVEDESSSACLFADALIGEQQVVMEARPVYIKKIKGLDGYTLLGDDSNSLIIEVGMLINNRKER